ncbi:MAG TPA: hypothetical protein PL089_04040 [Ignavibacteria bacterium]|mgnify:CR=1 FL=1|nr:hypothetical protein [Ignavibacteria bacterium]
MKEIYNFFIRDIYLSWSAIINKSFYSSEIFLFIIVCGLISITCFFFRKRVKEIKLIMIMLSLIFIIYLLLILPFYRGEIINGYFKNGLTLIEKIEEYKKNNGTYPLELNSIISKNSDDERYIKLNKNYFYKYFDKDEMNAKFKTDYYKENYFELKIRILEFQSPIYRYDKERNKFIIDD